jgi:RimJ/RimL family protein N-acetyltransferase
MTHGKKQMTPARERATLIPGERLILRAPRMPDANFVYTWEHDDEVWRYDPRRPYTDSMRDFLPLFEHNYVRTNGRQYWFIIEDTEHTPIGTITYFNFDQRNAQAEIGLGIGDKSYWGKGFGTEAIRTLTTYLWSYRSLQRLYAETALANIPARKAFLRAGWSEIQQIEDPRQASNDPWILLEIWQHRRENNCS